MKNKILALFLGSMRAKIIFIVVWLHAVLVLFIMGDLVSKQEKFMEKQAYAEGQNMASVISANAPSWLISNDVAGLNEILNGFEPIQKVKLALILDEKFKVIASTDDSLVGIYLDDTYSKELKEIIEKNKKLSNAQVWHDNSIDSIHTIAVGGVAIGYSRVILDTSELQKEVSKLKQDGIVYVILAMLFGALFSWFTVHTMTKQLMNLSQAANEVANGNLDIQIPFYKGNDEVALLTNDFHKMVKQLQKGVLLSKLATLGEMIGHIAHQWRQPLSVVSTIASSIKFQHEMGFEKDDKKIIENMGTIVSQCIYLSKTIDDFRNFVKDEKVEEQLQMIQTIQKTITIISPSLQSNNVELIANFEDDITILGFENELIQSFVNIINNAKDVLVENIENYDDRLIVISTHKNEDKFVLTIQDSGGGIPDEILPKIFNAYFTTKSKETGTGLGLSMVQTIITEHHNGNIIVRNNRFTHNHKEYIGACFEVTFNINNENNI